MTAVGEIPAMPRPVAGLVERERLFDLLDRGAQGPVTLLSAPAGSGKTTLLSSWLRRADLPGPAAWVRVERGETDATRFWGTVVDALREAGAVAAGDPLETLAPAPGGEHEFVRRLIEGVRRLPQRIHLVLDDLQELRSDEALRGLERLIDEAPSQVSMFLVSRRDPAVGLHRLRLSGELTEIRASDLDFTADESGRLMAASGLAVDLPDLERLHDRTEGWAAGLRLAAMSLARHDEPERFVAEFSGTERTVAEYLVGEVLSSQPPEVRGLLLRTGILERVSGPLADHLTDRVDGTRILSELEQGGGLVVAEDVARSWFRYHHLLADLLRLELTREAPDEVPVLHRRAAGWLAEHGHLREAIHHAEAGEDWELAADLLGHGWVHLLLDGEEQTLGMLLARLPADLATADAELAAITAADRLAESRWGEADGLMEIAERELAALPDARRARAETTLATVQLLRARRLGDVEGVIEGAHAMLKPDGDADPDLAGLALMNLGIAEGWTLRLAEAETHLERGLELGRTVGRPFIEVGCLGGLGLVANMTQRLDDAEDLLRQASEVADRVGWSAQPIVGATNVTLAAVLAERGRFSEAEEWLARAEPVLVDSPEPAAVVGLRHAQGTVALARGRLQEAQDRFRDGERLTEQLRAPHFLAAVERQWVLRTSIGLGDLEPVREALAEADDHAAFWRNLRGRLSLADDEPEGAIAAVAPVLAGETFVLHPTFDIEALLLDALARERLEGADAAVESVERALALAEPQGRVYVFLTVPGVRELLEGHPAHRTAHGAHLKTLLDHMGGSEPAGGGAPEPSEPLSDRELAVLRFLPTNLSSAEIGNEMFLSVHTVKTHMRKLYAKLDVHTRAEAVARGRALGLLAPARRGD